MDVISMCQLRVRLYEIQEIIISEIKIANITKFGVYILCCVCFCYGFCYGSPIDY